MLDSENKNGETCGYVNFNRLATWRRQTASASVSSGFACSNNSCTHKSSSRMKVLVITLSPKFGNSHSDWFFEPRWETANHRDVWEVGYVMSRNWMNRILRRQHGGMGRCTYNHWILACVARTCARKWIGFRPRATVSPYLRTISITSCAWKWHKLLNLDRKHKQIRLLAGKCVDSPYSGPFLYFKTSIIWKYLPGHHVVWRKRGARLAKVDGFNLKWQFALWPERRRTKRNMGRAIPESDTMAMRFVWHYLNGEKEAALATNMRPW